MRQYILKRTFVTHDGSVYPARSKPYYESELPALALQPAFAVLFDEGIDVVTPKPVEKNVIEQHYNGVEDKNVIEQHFQPSYHELETPEEAQPIVDLSSWNSPDHTIDNQKTVYLNTATVEELAALPYVSNKTAAAVHKAIQDGTIFSSMADLDKFHKLGFGKSWAVTGLVLTKE